MLARWQSTALQPSAMIFTRPTIGPKVYLSRGPSGHNETFLRDLADRELGAFLGAINLRIAVEGFIRKMKLRAPVQPEHWTDVLGFLGELTKLKPDHIPIVVVVAFWAHVGQVREANQRAQLEAVGN